MQQRKARNKARPPRTEWVRLTARPPQIGGGGGARKKKKHRRPPPGVGGGGGRRTQHNIGAPTPEIWGRGQHNNGAPGPGWRAQHNNHKHCTEVGVDRKEKNRRRARAPSALRAPAILAILTRLQYRRVGARATKIHHAYAAVDRYSSTQTQPG